MILVGTAIFPRTLVAAYYTSCYQQDNEQRFYTTLDRDSSSLSISAVLMDVDLRALNPCTQNSYWYDLSIVAATLEYGDGSSRGVQIGYLKCGKSGGCSGGVPADGKPHFWSTHGDAESGAIFVADGPNGWFAAPVLGYRYRMKVEAITQNGLAKWQYCIRNVSTGGAYACHFEPRTWAAGTFAWWGTETGNKNTQNGTRAIDPDINLIGQYKKSGVWYQRSGSDNTCVRTAVGTTYPSYYSCYVMTDETTLWSYTYDH